MTKEVLQDALELLAVATFITPKLQAKRTDVINAGLQALAEQPAQQEPVAWREFDGEGGYFYRDYYMNEQYAQEWDQRNPDHKGWVEPLYTSPPAQQEPLTDIYRSFEQWKSGNVLEHGVPRTEFYTKADLDLVEMGWNYGHDAGRAVEQALDKMAENARELGLDYEPAQQEPVFTYDQVKAHIQAAMMSAAQRIWVGLSDAQNTVIWANSQSVDEAIRATEKQLMENNI